MRDGKTHQLRIETPEGIEFSMTLGGPAVRAVSWAIDVAFLMLMQLGLVMVTVRLFGWAADLLGAILALGTFVIWFGYFVLLEWLWKGRTIGKRMMKLRVIDASGLRLRFSQVLIRNMVRVLDAAPLGMVGGLSCWFSPRCQRFGDLVAGTVVVRYAEESEPELARLDSDKYNSLREHSNLVVRLRDSISPQEAGYFLGALLGRTGYGDAERIELFRFLVEYLRESVDLPEDVTHGMSDEKVIHNVVDILFHA